MTLALLSFVAEPAFAHYVYGRGPYYEVDGYCGLGYSEISHGSSGMGYWKGSSFGQKPVTYPFGGTANCLDAWKRPARSYAARVQKWYWAPLTGTSIYAWQICDASNGDTGWRYSGQNGSGVKIAVNALWGDHPECGAGYYAAFTGVTTIVPSTGHWYKQNGQYVWMWSGADCDTCEFYHYLPA